MKVYSTSGIKSYKNLFQMLKLDFTMENKRKMVI